MTTAQPTYKKGHPWRAFFLFAAAVASGVTMFNMSQQPRTPDPDVLRITAEQACEGAVGQNLKAPATAQYNSQASGSGPWRVVGTVDAENSFGALIRSEYQCTVRLEGNRAIATLEFLE